MFLTTIVISRHWHKHSSDIKRDLKDWNITKELAIHRGAWKLTIHVPES
uniref:Uncharacterized protein n=1 Tax=Arundo donax TaxID=35708 RepID=A0A0A9H5E4_ARUDO